MVSQPWCETILDLIHVSLSPAPLPRMTYLYLYMKKTSFS